MAKIIITIPDYPDKILVSKARRAKYYVSENSLRTGSTKIPKRYTSTKYGFDADGILCNLVTGEYILANPRTAGKPRYWVVNFQEIWNNALTKQRRAGLTGKLKDILRPYIRSIRAIKTGYPLAIEIVLYDTQFPVDVSNKGVIYTKIIEDLLVSENKLPDDSIRYINSSGKTTCLFIDDVKKKRMEIIITKSSLS